MKKITLELDAEDAELVRGVLDNFVHYKMYSSTGKATDRLEVKRVVKHISEQINVAEHGVVKSAVIVQPDEQAVS